MELYDKRILITGGSGFLGKHLTHALASRHHTILEIDNTKQIDTNRPSVFVTRSSTYDLIKRENCQRLLEVTRPHLVIHLAALTGGIGANRARPAEFYYNNMAMGLNILDASYHYGVDKFVGVGSVCGYPKHTPVPFQERDIWNGYPEETNAPYGLAKKMLMVQGQAYRQQYQFNSIHLIPTNLYGTGDNFDQHTSHVIPALIRKFAIAKQNRQSTVTLWGTGQATREFLFAPDAAEYIIRASAWYDSPAPLNLGSGNSVSIADLAHELASIIDYRGEVVWDRDQPDGQPVRQLCCIKTRRHLGIINQTTLKEGLIETVKWFYDNVMQTISREGNER